MYYLIGLATSGQPSQESYAHTDTHVCLLTGNSHSSQEVSLCNYKCSCICKPAEYFLCVCVGGSKAKSTQCYNEMLASTSTRAESACHTTAEQKPLEVRVYQITWRSSSLSISICKCILFPCSHCGKVSTPPVFPLLLCLATCGTQPLQYPAVHQTKSGMRNILRLPANSYENMLRPNLKQFAMANNTHWLTDPCRAQQAEHSTSSCL